MEPIIIGIAGGTGSGKTTLARKLYEYVGPGKAVMISHDAYYKRHDNMPYEERCKLNYDHPDSIETDLMIQHLQMLKEGKSVDVPVYDYTVHNRSDKVVHISPAPIIIVEGILLFSDPVLCDQMNMKIFVDTDADVRILRRIRRDVNKRGRSLESVIKQYLDTVKPMHEQFVEPSKRRADLIVPEGGKNQKALNIILRWVEANLPK